MDTNPHDASDVAYRIFLQADATYGVAVTASGELVHTETGFSSKAEADAWIKRDGASLEQPGGRLEGHLDAVDPYGMMGARKS
jgi:hypothetical protein